jgi:hypothetical protein
MLMEDGTAAAPGLSFAADLDTGIFRPAANQFAIATDGIERIEIGTSEIVINDGGEDIDFRVEGDTQANLFFVDAGNERVGIGTNSPAAELHVASASPFIRIQDTDSAVASSAQGGFELYDSDGDRLFFLANEASDSADVSLFNNAGAGLLFGTSGAEKARIDGSGRLLAGTSTALTNVYQNAGAITPQNQFASQQDGYDGGLSLINYSSSGYSSTLSFGQSKTDTLGANVLTTNGEPLGIINFTGNDGADFRTAAQIMCIVDGVTGSGDMPGRLTFSTTADGAATPTERMRISQAGRLSAFTTSNDGHGFRSSQASSASHILIGGLRSATNTADGTFVFVVRTNGQVENSTGVYGTLSDIKLKENIIDASSQWQDIKSLRIVNYNFKEETGYDTYTQLGVIAQEVELVSPGLVSKSNDKDEENNDIGTVTKSVKSSVLYMKAVKALQEAMTRIETLEAKVAALEAG